MIKHAFVAIPLTALTLAACMPPHIADAQKEWVRVHNEIDRQNLYGYRPPSAYAPAQGASPKFLYSNPSLTGQAAPAPAYGPYAPIPRTSTTCEFLGRTLYCDHR